MGLDVHAETIAVAIAEPDGEVRSLGIIPNREESVRHGRRAPAGINPWTLKYMDWVREQVRFEQPAQEYTRWDYLHEVDHVNDRVRRLEEAIREAVKLAPAAMREVIQALQALRGIAEISAVTIVSELGQISRLPAARELMGYSGTVASEDSSGKRVQRGGITKTGNVGNAHLRRVIVEAAGAYRHPPALGATLRKRQEGLREEVQEIAWKAQHRLQKRYRSLAAPRQESADDCDRRRTRITRFHLGHRKANVFVFRNGQKGTSNTDAAGPSIGPPRANSSSVF